VRVDLAEGQVLGAYTLVERVGRGGMGIVWKAYQASLARYVAVKVLPDELAGDPSFRARFREEAINIAGLRHPNILAVFDYGELAGGAYIVTEFIDGGTLDEQLGTALPADYAVNMLRPIAAALDYAHSRGVIHRDVKPQNILLTREGTPMLSDFGLARMMSADRQVTSAGMVLGTPNYMAPEQAQGLPEPASDQYALAIVAYEMVTGRVPYSAPTPMGVVIAHQTGPLPPPRSINPEIPTEVEAVVVKALAREPKERYSSASAFIRALAQETPSLGQGPRPPVPPATPPPVAAASDGGGGGRRWLIAVGALLVLALLGGGGYLAYRQFVHPPPAPPDAPTEPKTAVWEQWKKIPGILDVQSTSTPGRMMAVANNKLVLVDATQVQPYAQGQDGFTGAGAEPYLAVSPGLHLAGCDFGTDQAFALRLTQPLGITHIDTHGKATELAKIPGVNDMNGLVFDTVGKFGQRLLVISDSANDTTVNAVDCQGKVTRIGTTVPKFEGGLAIAPNSFSSFGGNLIGPGEFDGKIYAIDPNGQAKVVANSGLPSGQDVGVESAGFVPFGFIGSSGSAYVADRASGNQLSPGTDTLLRLTAGALKDAGVQDGDLLMATEGGGRTIAVRCDPSCAAREIGHASSGAHIEGHIVFLMQ
jgi:hypothetical protein